MARYVKIQKYKAFNNIHYYFVSSTDLGNCQFYMDLDPEKNHVILYVTNDFTKPFKIINLNDPHALFEAPPPIEMRAAKLSIGQGMKAIQKNEFPEYISYCA